MEKLIEAKYNLKVVNYAMMQENRDKLDIEESLLAARTIAMELGALLNRFTKGQKANSFRCGMDSVFI